VRWNSKDKGDTRMYCLRYPVRDIYGVHLMSTILPTSRLATTTIRLSPLSCRAIEYAVGVSWTLRGGWRPGVAARHQSRVG
jgi:hypothetical protein